MPVVHACARGCAGLEPSRHPTKPLAINAPLWLDLAPLLQRRAACGAMVPWCRARWTACCASALWLGTAPLLCASCAHTLHSCSWATSGQPLSRSARRKKKSSRARCNDLLWTPGVFWLGDTVMSVALRGAAWAAVYRYAGRVTYGRPGWTDGRQHGMGRAGLRPLPRRPARWISQRVCL